MNSRAEAHTMIKKFVERTADVTSKLPSLVTLTNNWRLELRGGSRKGHAYVTPLRTSS